MNPIRSSAALAAAALAMLISAHGFAYCLTRTCDPDNKAMQCEVDQFNCIISGKTLYWPNSCVSFDVQKNGSEKLNISYDTLHGVVAKAFQQWVNADCGKGKHPSIQVADYGPVDCAKPEYNKDQPNANVITFHDGPWPHTNALETLALATVFFNGDTGEIYDANIEINSDMNTFSDGDAPGGQYDLNAVLTHEVGHFLGLSHSSVGTATMYQSYSTDMATLDPDDESAICLSLPPDRIVSNDCTPRHGFSGACGKPETGCCATAIGSNASTNQTLGLFGLGLGLCAWRGRRWRLAFRRSASRKALRQ